VKKGGYLLSVWLHAFQSERPVISKRNVYNKLSLIVTCAFSIDNAVSCEQPLYSFTDSEKFKVSSEKTEKVRDIKTVAVIIME